MRHRFLIFLSLISCASHIAIAQSFVEGFSGDNFGKVSYAMENMTLHDGAVIIGGGIDVNLGKNKDRWALCNAPSGSLATRNIELVVSFSLLKMKKIEAR